MPKRIPLQIPGIGEAPLWAAHIKTGPPKFQGREIELPVTAVVRPRLLGMWAIYLRLTRKKSSWPAF
jgi:hypothetical protein